MSAVAAKPTPAPKSEPKRQAPVRPAPAPRLVPRVVRAPGVPQPPAYTRVGGRGGEPLTPLRRPPIRDASPPVRAVLATGGAPLATPVRAAIEISVGVDLDGVRVHENPDAAAVVEGAGARAFALGPHVFLGRGERSTDLALMAHEVAHVVQQQDDAGVQSTPHAGAGVGPDGFEQEADRVSAAMADGRPAHVVGRTSVRPQFSIRGWISRKASAAVDAVSDAAGAVVDAVGDAIKAALNYIRDHVHDIPGYDMLAFILGRDPITQDPVSRTPPT